MYESVYNLRVPNPRMLPPRVWASREEVSQTFSEVND